MNKTIVLDKHEVIVDREEWEALLDTQARADLLMEVAKSITDMDPKRSNDLFIRQMEYLKTGKIPTGDKK